MTRDQAVTEGLSWGLELFSRCHTFEADSTLLGMFSAPVTPEFREGMALAARVYSQRRGQTLDLRREAL